MRTAAATVLLAGALAACGPSGSGTIVTEDRPIESFDGLKVSSGLNVRLTVDPSSPGAVSVSYDDNLVDLITTEVNAGILVIEAGSYSTTGGGRFITVSAPNLTSIDASGGSDVEGAGTAAALAVTASGGADIDLSMLATTRMVVDASGGSDIVVLITDDISGNASGGADVTVLGEPSRMAIETSGGADVDVE